MPKFKQKEKKDTTHLICKVGSKESVNSGELAFLQSTNYEGLIRPLCEVKKTIKTISFDISNKPTLKSYILNPHNKASFLDVLSQIAKIIRFCDNNNLSMKKIVFDLSMIYVDPIDKKLLFIYYPAENYQQDKTIEELLKSIGRNLVVPQTTNCDFLIEYRKYTEALNYFALVDFERKIEAMQDSKQKGEQKKKRNSGHFSGKMAFDLFGDEGNDEEPIEPEIKSEKCYCDNCREYFPIGTKFCSGCGANLTPIRGNTAPPLREDFPKREKPKTEEKKKRQTKLIKKIDEKNYPSLIRIRTNEEVKIDKDTFSVGYDEECDYSFTDNEAISGHHVDIIVDDSKVYIIDQGSTNGTYINDKETPYFKKTVLHDGDKVELADEIFVFKGIEN